MALWPFFLGRFVELPYTLVQDYTLTEVLGKTSPRLWLEKVDFIAEHRGMALLNAHPDYLRSRHTWAVYEAFLERMAERRDAWHALPREVARWWRARSEAEPGQLPAGGSRTVIRVSDLETSGGCGPRPLLPFNSGSSDPIGILGKPSEIYRPPENARIGEKA